MPRAIEYELFCKRTEDPKLSYIESLLDSRKIRHRRNGFSAHGPILEVDSRKTDAAWELLSLRGKQDLGLPVRPGVQLDDIPDDHKCFPLVDPDPLDPLRRYEPEYDHLF